MTRAALYARYSSDNQREASIEDQFRLCREHAARERWQIVGSYEDAAISGASTILRPGIQRLMRDAQHGEFNILLAEALDRISRDQADVATLYKHLKFAGVTIVTLAEGEISELHVGLKGTMNALFLKDLADKTRRGLRGRVEKGKAGGGLCYGYRVVKKFDADGEPIRGDREIIPEEAEIVRRIFREFASCKSPKAIAVDLNRDGVPGPLGRAWGDTSIRGHVSRGTGIVNNELYAGVLVWNRQHFVKDPSTGKRVSRINPPEKWIRSEVPHLRIVDDELWNAVRARQKDIAVRFEATAEGVRKAKARKLHEKKRPVSLLSGLLTCGRCGGKYGLIMRDRYGCLNHHRRGNCDNNRTITRDKIEERVLSGLKDRLISSRAVEETVRAFADEMNRLNRERRAQGEQDRKALAKIEKAIAGIIAAIEDGMYQPSMKARMDELERQKAEIIAQQMKAPTDTPDVHPNIGNIYRKRVEWFTDALHNDDDGRVAAEELRSLIEEVVLMPGEKRGEVHAKLRGELFGILDFVEAEHRQRPGEVRTKVVAGPRNQNYQSYNYLRPARTRGFRMSAGDPTPTQQNRPPLDKSGGPHLAPCRWRLRKWRGYRPGWPLSVREAPKPWDRKSSNQRALGCPASSIGALVPRAGLRPGAPECAEWTGMGRADAIPVSVSWLPEGAAVQMRPSTAAYAGLKSAMPDFSAIGGLLCRPKISDLF